MEKITYIITRTIAILTMFVFLILKVLKIINWNWIWIFSPVLIFFGLKLLLLIATFLVLALKYRISSPWLSILAIFFFTASIGAPFCMPSLKGYEDCTSNSYFKE